MYNKQKLNRLQKGIELFKQNSVFEKENIIVYEVYNQDKTYTILFDKRENCYICNCKDFKFNGYKYDCKHIHAVKLYKESI